MLHQVQVPIGNMPVHLVLLSDGTLVFIRVATIGYLVDQDSDGNTLAIFTDENFSIGNQDLWYNTIYQYKNNPDMLKWLQRQNLIEPVIRFA